MILPLIFQRPSNLLDNVLCAPSGQVWSALAEIGRQLQILAGVQKGEGTFFAPALPAHAVADTLTLAELTNEFLRAKARAGRSERYLRALRYRNAIQVLTHDGVINDYNHERYEQPQNTLIVGMTGSGKTTFVNRLLLNSKPACRFIFDDLNRMTSRLNLKPLYLEREMEVALPSRWISFHPARMFPGDTKNALKWWCHWIFQVASRGPGEKMVCVPEVWRHCTEDSIPVEFALLVQAGRELNIHVIVDTQRPEKINPSITGAATELVCFKLLSPESLREVEKLGMNKQQVAALAPGSFIARNQMSGGLLAGKLF